MLKRITKLGCWVSTRKIVRKHPTLFHTCYGVSHVTYLIVAATHGEWMYAAAAGPAAVAYVLAWIAIGPNFEETRND